jgi:hypothetical protein
VDPFESPDETLWCLQRDTFRYFWEEIYPVPDNGLIADNTGEGAPASIAVVGFALAAYPVAVERGLLPRDKGVARTLATLRFFRDSPHGPEPDATGYRGFYYHFLDMRTGRRVWQCELSTIDSTFLLAGMLTAAAYFDHDTAAEHEIRTTADALYRKADWRWAQNGGATVSHGWRPETGFLPYRWEGYDEALLLYALGLGSPTHPLPDESYPAWAATYEWKEIFGQALLYAGPLFIHQFSHLWIDFRGIQDAFMREHGLDYFENSRRAAHVQRDYATRNPLGFEGYGPWCWGLTASDGPGPATLTVKGVKREFFGYLARGAPFGPDDGTVAPWAAVACLPFAPDIVVEAIRHFHDLYPEIHRDRQFKCSFNPTFPDPTHGRSGWVADLHFGLNEGPIVLMIENHRSGLLWRLMRGCPYLVAGLRRAGFSGGWLESERGA